jgi:hypothetical protein
MGGSTEDVALVVAGPFIGHLFSPVFGYLLARFRPVAITAVTATVARTLFLVGVLVVATPFALAFVSVTMWIIAVANMASYATLMQGIYPDSERGSAMGSSWRSSASPGSGSRGWSGRSPSPIEPTAG